MKADAELLKLVADLESQGRVIEPQRSIGIPIDPPTLSEKDFQAAVMDLARLRNWRCYHVLYSRKSAPGWPDFVGIRGPRLVVAELKVPPNEPTAAQEEWLCAFRAVPGAEVHLWYYPADWQAIEDTLR